MKMSANSGGPRQGCGSGSAWIRIHVPSLIRILIHKKLLDPGPQKMNADPQPWSEDGTLRDSRFYNLSSVR